MFQRMVDSLRRFMMGRNGMDTLNWALWVVAILMEIIGTIAGIEVLSMISIVPLYFVLFRIFSRNLEKRQAENLALTQFISRLKGRKTHCYFRCPGCKTQVRVPKGKGKIKITCPVCGHTFIKKT